MTAWFSGMLRVRYQSDSLITYAEMASAVFLTRLTSAFSFPAPSP